MNKNMFGGNPLAAVLEKANPPHHALQDRALGVERGESPGGRWDGGRQIAATVALLGCALAILPATGYPADDDERFERYLIKLGLTDLQALHLEKRLEDATTPEDRLAIARKLADVYAGQLLDAAEDSARFEIVMRNIEGLARRVPEARSDSLTVTRLQAHYYRAEPRVTSWLADQSDETARREALQILERISPELIEIQARLTAQVKKLIERSETLEAGDELERVESDLSQLRPVAGSAMYFAATSSYYAALLGGEMGQTGYAAAREVFRRLLGIEDEYKDYDASDFGLESVWRSRAMVGLALSEAALGNQQASEACFTWLEDRGVPPTVRDQLPYWRLRAMADHGRAEAILDFARRQVELLSQTSSLGKISFCVGLARIGFGGKLDTPEAREIGLLGLTGLARLRRSGIASRLLEEYDVVLPDDAGFHLQWIAGQRQFDRATKSRLAADFQTAAAALGEALEAPGAAGDINAVAQCRDQLARCYYQLGQREKAAQLFEQAADGLHASGDPGAINAAWNAFVTYEALAKEQPRFVSSAVDALQRIKRDFPASSYARNAAYRMGKLRQESVAPRELLAQLEKVKTDSPDYLAARFDICLLLRRIWEQATGTARQEAARKLAKSVEVYLEVARRERASKDRSAKASLLVVETAVQADPPDLAVAEAFLARAWPLINALPPSSPIAAEARFRSMQVAKAKGNAPETNRHATWLTNNARGSVYEKAALILAIKADEQALREAAPGDRQAHQQVVLERLARLVELLGDAPAKLAVSAGDSPQEAARKKNARAANSKLARYATELGRHEQAAQVLEGLVTAAPREKSYLQRAGRAQFLAGNYQASIKHWRKLLAGVKRGSDDWYEAKYHQLACLRHLNADQFGQVAAQFRLMYPDRGSPAWRERFRELLGE